MDTKRVCTEHNKEYEMFWVDERGEREQMCSICVCNRLKKMNIKEVTHMASAIKDDMEKFEEELKAANLKEKQIKEYNSRAERHIKTRDEIQAKLERKLEDLKKLYAKQKDMTAENGGTILKCHENVLKEIRKCEHKLKENLKDPKRVQRAVDSMVEEHKYWDAYQEVLRARKEDTRLEDDIIIKELARYEKLLTEYQDQLVELDITPLHAAQYKKLLDENRDMSQEIAQHKSIVSFLDILPNIIIEDLTILREKNTNYEKAMAGTNTKYLIALLDAKKNFEVQLQMKDRKIQDVEQAIKEAKAKIEGIVEL